MSKRITLTCVDCGGGHACGLAIGLKKYGQVTSVWENRNKHGLDYLVPDAKFGYRRIPKEGDHLIIVSCITWDRIKLFFGSYGWKRLLRNYGKVHIIITDGRFARYPEQYNPQFEGIDVLTTACKRHFRGDLPTKTYYQPFDLRDIWKEKYTKLTVAHSPFVPAKFREKGTVDIKRIVGLLDVDLDIITGVSWDECLRRKAPAHIFVDQIDHYDRDKFKFRDPDYIWPALGKSGIEALHLGCAVITYGAKHDTEIPAPPVAWVTKDTFEETLLRLVNSPDERDRLAHNGTDWALKYASYDYAARNVLGLN